MCDRRTTIERLLARKQTEGFKGIPPIRPLTPVASLPAPTVSEPTACTHDVYLHEKLKSFEARCKKCGASLPIVGCSLRDGKIRIETE